MILLRLRITAYMEGELMKKHRIIAMVLLACCVFGCFLSHIVCTAVASEMPDKLVEQVEESLNVSVFYQEETKRLIKCFDVNEDGCFAIGFNNNTVQIYDAHGTFQCGYSFHVEGTYGLDIKENSIVIYLARSDIAVELDKAGNCVSAEKVQFFEHIDKAIDRTSKKVGNMQYFLERDIGLFDGYYSRFVSIDESGIREILYDTTIRGYFSGVLQYMLLSIFPIGFIVLIVRKIKEEKQT